MKAVKKRKRRLKKAIRKTLGTLFLISAIVVAAIPVDGLQAADSVRVTVDMEKCKIPLVDENETIYTTGDGQYQFAYVRQGASANKVAVILGADMQYLQGNALEIPNTLDAYLKYSDNLGTVDGYVAVGQSGNFLFYQVMEQAYDSNGNPLTEWVQVTDPNTGLPVLNPDGSIQMKEEPKLEPKYYPCYYRDYSKWGNLGLEDFYYNSNTVSGGNPVYVKTTTAQYQRIQNVEVWYIGNQYLKEDNGTWKIDGKITQPSQGIFAEWGSIRTLTVGEKLSGIGNYAFYGCSGLDSITLRNGLNTIGNYAFANCVNLTSVNLDLYTNLDVIGDHAFYNCQALRSFRLPVSVREIGDSAFQDCWAMTSIEFGDGTVNVVLDKLGWDVFVGCRNLQSVTFPRTFTNAGDPLDVGIFEGCSSLAFISASNNNIDFTEDAAGYGSSFGFEDLKNTAIPEFYLEGLTDSPVHKTATEKNIAFSHLGIQNGEIIKLNQYEITSIEKGKKAVFRVNSNNELIYCDLENGIETVTLPATIGPYKIQKIDSTTFQNKCSLKKITIPSSITEIAASAFKGCHNLKNVIFKEPCNLTSIGTGAFSTQDVSFHQGSCSDDSLQDTPELYFTGPISDVSAPFQYAMDPANNINVGSQQRSYITYYSGWPTNLAVRYNYNTDRNELIDYPTFKELVDGKYTENAYAYMTSEYEQAAKDAVNKYISNADSMTDYEKQIINAALNPVLPEGIETIKSGLFAEKEAQEVSNQTKTLTAYGLREIAGGQYNEADDKFTGGDFSGLSNYTAFYLMGDDTVSIGDYAFADCEKLATVTVPPTVNSLGLRPFTRCEQLSHVNFQESPYFVCDNSIIFGLDSAGNKAEVVEFLCARKTGVVAPTELEGVTSIAPEAFAETNVSSVDLRSSAVEDIPEGAFEKTPRLFAVYLPNTCKSISQDSFKDSSISYMEVPSSVTYLDNDAFSGSTQKSSLQFYCEDGSNAYIYAQKQGILTTSKPIELSFQVTFMDWDTTVLDVQTVEAGMDAVPPAVPGRPGYIHTGWVPDYHGITSNMNIVAQYDAEDPDASKFTVTFLDYDDTVLKTVLVAPGGDAEAPVNPTREGYIFTGWRPSITNIQANTIVYAQYEKIDSTQKQLIVRFIDYDDTVLYTQRVNYGEDAIIPQAPSREGYTFTGWRPAVTAVTQNLDTYAQYERGGDNNGGNGDNNNGGNGDNNNNGNNNNNGGNNNNNGTGSSNTGSSNTTTKFYTLTVMKGSGSGSYAAGSQPIIVADDPPAGYEFSNWTIDPSDVTIASKVLSATVITMPEKNVTITANYKMKSGTSTGGGTSSNNNANRPGSESGSISKGTTVVIDKNGLSNTGVVSATVNGSSDNFTIKITESREASEAVLRALIAEYGDVTNINYFPMDISLYDETGTKKITDTTGLSISITLPLPDSLITYAGNNKVAGVVNDRLDKLTPKFTTISGVSCITFTAEHFSPYVIYVDTNNLTAGTVTDSTPKTGDGIHPKWFLSIGLACISVVLFMKKDKKAVRRATA